MESYTLLLGRWAVRIHSLYQRQAEQRFEAVDHRIGRVGSALDSVTRVRRRLATCRYHGWRGAAKAQFDDLRYSLRELREEADDCQRAMDTAEKPVPEPRHFLQELQQLDSEFGEVSFDQEHAHLTVTTEPIKMEGIPLGRFEIRLELNRPESTDASEWLKIIAREPNAASSDHTVTHPHVRDERLCAGEASAAMNRALSFGNFCDLFLLARAVLQTYNDGSPYVALDKWDGNPCHDCGFNMDSDESCWCHGCEHDFCDQCYTRCRGCDADLCRGCMAPCSCCEDLCCGSCLSRCSACKESCCPSCRAETLCSDCQPGENHDTPIPASTSPNPAEIIGESCLQTV